MFESGKKLSGNNVAAAPFGQIASTIAFFGIDFF